MNELQVFNYHGNEIRTVEKDGDPWFVLKDVCGVLGITDHKSVGRRLEDDERGVGLIHTPGGSQEMTIINEPGLYKVILRSDKPNAQPLMRWVTHEVLPSIRRTGAYSVPAMTPAQLIAAQAKLLVEMEQRMDAMQEETRALSDKVDTAIKVFSRPSEDHWKADMDMAIKELCEEQTLSVTATKGRMYADLERAAGCNVDARLSRLRSRKKKAGARHRDVMQLNKLDAIAADKQLRAIFEGVVRRWQARYAGGVSVQAIAERERNGHEVS